MNQHLTIAELEAGLPPIQDAPRDHGVVRGIVIRPASDQRLSLTRCDFSLAGGVHGDAWARGCWKSLPDGRPDPDVQVAIMNSRAIALIARDPGCSPLAGDNLFADFNLSRESLFAGQQLAVGTVILEITDVPHNGCSKFAERFGADAVKFVNSEAGKRLRLRGVYARVVQDGTVSVGDVIRKL
jgi:hypothetical protein